MRAIFFIREIFRKHPLLFIGNTLLLGFETLIEATAIIALIPVVDLLIKPNLEGASFITHKAAGFMNSIGIPVGIGAFMAVFLGFNIVVSFFKILIRYLILQTKYALCRDLILGTFEDFFRAKWSFFSSHRQGTLINTFINEVNIVGNAFGAMALFFASFVQLIVFLIVPFYLSWQITSISLLAALLFALPFTLLGKVNYRLGKLNTSTANQMSSVIQESLTLAKVILGFGNQQQSVKMLERAFEAHRQATLKSQTLSIAVPIIYYPLGLLVLVISFFAARKFAVPLSETAALLYSLLKVVPLIGTLPSQKNSLDNFFPSYEQVLNLQQSARQLRQVTGTKIFTGFNKAITIKNLSFAYSGRQMTLSDINVCIPKGKMVAFVGKSGGGKSTLIDMIMGFNKPLTGQISLDDIPLEEFEINSYRKRIGYVPQDSILFNMTIRDNLRWSNELATQEEIEEACRRANADEFIEEFPKGYDTLTGDRGVRLSGGQIQRIALARAILRKPVILILDEATSSLDTHSERLIQQAIDNIAKETTVIVIAHRLSTVVSADYICVMRKGRIAEEGTYVELVQKKGEFHQMLQLQALGRED